MFLLQLIALLPVLVSAQAKADSGCPKLARSAPAASKPKNCPDPKTVPAVKGTLRDNECLVGGIMGGDFFNACYAPDMKSAIGSIVSGTSKAKQDWSGGSGPFNAKYFTDPSLPFHTIYAPKVVVPGKKLPLLVWANGACGTNGASFTNFLTELSSHGFLIIATGSPKIPWGTTIQNYASTLLSNTDGEKSRAAQLTEAIDWAFQGAAGGKYGDVDVEKVGAAGQSCGGVEAYSASVLDKRVRVVGIYNTGVIDPGRRWYLKEMKQVIGYFHGGKADFSYSYIEQDFMEIPPTLSAIKSQLPVGHMGTFFEPQGGKFGKASVAFWKWQLQGDEASKALFFNKSSSLYADGWQIDTSHWKA
ncbi:alpha/beta hydrolase [Venturia nashicola]|nr:alpha/beta hydrolase [Venturia nashicola]